MTQEKQISTKQSLLDKFYFCDVEDGKLYKLTKVKQKELLKKHPLWYSYSLDDNALLDVLEYFKKNGEVVASSRNKNLFVGFTA